MPVTVSESVAKTNEAGAVVEVKKTQLVDAQGVPLVFADETAAHAYLAAHRFPALREAAKAKPWSPTNPRPWFSIDPAPEGTPEPGKEAAPPEPAAEPAKPATSSEPPTPRPSRRSR